ncbi:hypothetical protein MPRF_37260 [Mycolicibacterium parafortuitum]|uniref:Amidase domain-containing protein n=1 Tax=Mycolicibacterium parafortuitum TaxID=39692 RepID=A0A7I7U680_MYCPF|nr:hypothetical protein MPRF_37260 [Mycolicibacterium parafortuitum]
MSVVDLPLVEVSDRIRRGELTSLAVTEELLDRIERLDDAIGAFSFVAAEEALARAASLDAEVAKGMSRGALHGVPIAVKDIFDVDGWPSEIGMPSRRGAVSRGSCTAVTRLTEHGAVIVGKVHTTEGVYAEHTDPFRAPKSVEPGSLGRGFVQWQRGGGGGSPGVCRAGLRHRGLHPDAVRGDGFDRDQADLGSCQPRRRVRACGVAGSRRRDGAKRGGCGRRPPGDRRGR